MRIGWLSLGTFTYQRTADGGMDVKGHVERECAELLENLIHAFGTPTAEDSRSKQQRLGDAMAEVIDAASNAATLPTTGGDKPHLAVYLDMTVLTDAVGTATLESGTPLSASATRRLACDAEIIPIVLGGDYGAAGPGPRLPARQARSAQSVDRRGQGLCVSELWSSRVLV
jgi:hypothetical protein